MCSMPENSVYIVLGEVNLLVTAMRRSSRWVLHYRYDDQSDPLISNFNNLKEKLNVCSNLCDILPNEFLSPFLEVIRSEDTTGPITGLAISSVNKFLSYGLIESFGDAAASAIENIADAVTHARFVGTDPSSDEVVLMKILYVLRTLLLTPAGNQLTNESVCEIMQSCFRICFEMRLSELLRKSAEHTLMDMVQLLFSRLPQFSEEGIGYANIRPLKMRTGGIDSSRNRKRKNKPVKQGKKKTAEPNAEMTKIDHAAALDTKIEYSDGARSEENSVQEKQTESQLVDEKVQMGNEMANVDIKVEEVSAVEMKREISSDEGASAQDVPVSNKPTSEVDEVVIDDSIIATTPAESFTSIVDMHNSFQEASDPNSLVVSEVDTAKESDIDPDPVSDYAEETEPPSTGNFVNSQGVRFTPPQGPLVPYGLPSVRELFRFLISLTNPCDRHNTDIMVHMGLCLLTVALESGADHLSRFSSLLALVKDDMCRHLFMLLKSERLSLFAAALRVCFMLMESVRRHLKFQLEMYLMKLMDLLVSEVQSVSIEQHEMTLEAIVQLLRIPGFMAELYLNFDCDLNSSSLFEDLMKLLSKSCFPMSGISSTHLLSLEALLVVIDGIEQNCQRAPPRNPSKLDQLELEKGSLMQVRPNRMKISDNIPSESDLASVKHMKKIYQSGTDLFNQKPAKGIKFLQENNVLNDPIDACQVATFLKENPKLDKKIIGEYISSKKNKDVFFSYQRSFDFYNKRVDEALRMYLEMFRLPGEAPVIHYLMEEFALHWHKSNGEPFATVDAAFTLAYAVILLNVDQHNQNAKKQNKPMTCAQFKKNVSGVNGGGDFDGSMLDKIYHAIRNEEIVMPAEQTGIVKENYMWKVLLKRGASDEGHYLHVSPGTFDRDIFSLVWGPTIAAISFVLDKSTDEMILEKALRGLKKAAVISAHYNLSDVFDNLVISLCKFTSLLNQPESYEETAIMLGTNLKAQTATLTVFALAHSHADILREGWRNLLDCLLQLYRAKLLSKDLFVIVEDFVSADGVISLMREEEETSQHKGDSGVLSSLYSYLSLTESGPTKGPTLEEREAIQKAQSCVLDCHTEQIITDSKFLQPQALHELLKALMAASAGERSTHQSTPPDENAAVFYLEMLIKVVLQNKDRVGPFWPSIQDHLYSVTVAAQKPSFLLERSVVGLLRLAIRLLRREEIAPQVLSSIRMMLCMKPEHLQSVSCQLAFGLHDLLKTSAANIHSTQDWQTLFALLEVAGAGAKPQPVMSQHAPNDLAESLHEAGISSDSDVPNKPTAPPLAENGSWLMVNPEDVDGEASQINQFSIVLAEELATHEKRALLKCSESIAFLVRDTAHITPHNFQSCIHCIRTFVEASVLHQRKKSERRRNDGRGKKKAVEPAETTETNNLYQALSLQLLDLMHTLHTRVATIYSSWAAEQSSINAEGSVLWTTCWCPLLQGIARLCCDWRRQVRSQALTYLQRSLLIHDLQALSATDWECCFNKVLFPLLHKLLEDISTDDSGALEETRMRASTLLGKVFLQHLGPLLTLPTFTALWLTILEFMDKYMNSDMNGLLGEAIPESLKNMLLVMQTAGVLDPNQEQLWQLTWHRIDSFLPSLRVHMTLAAEANVQADREISETLAGQLAKTENESTANSPSAGLPPASSPALSSSPGNSPAASASPMPSPVSTVPEVAGTHPCSPTPSSPSTTSPCASPVLPCTLDDSSILESGQCILQPPLPSVHPAGQPVHSVPILIPPCPSQLQQREVSD